MSLYAQETKEFIYLNGKLFAVEPLPTYLVGDVFPKSSDTAGAFGDNALNNLDLIETLRAITNVPGFRPMNCSERFDSMDSFPVDSATNRGGDGALNNLDLIETLRRVTNIEPSRPRRGARGNVCSTSSATTLQFFTRAEIKEGDPFALLEFGEAQVTGTTRSIPVFLKTRVTLTSLSVGLGAPGSNLQVRFSAANGGVSPTMVDFGVPGSLAIAWLNPIPATTGQSTFLGAVQVSNSADSIGIIVYGAEGNDGDGRRTSVSVAGLPVLRTIQ